mmetsp:Transcript_5114/g.18357  ORF Transcript_5114/g.18357 Transcript_5114/m.18357 type:complete len:205 (-) Transcript_5114:328-942(-)
MSRKWSSLPFLRISCSHFLRSSSRSCKLLVSALNAESSLIFRIFLLSFPRTFRFRLPSWPSPSFFSALSPSSSSPDPLSSSLSSFPDASSSSDARDCWSSPSLSLIIGCETMSSASPSSSPSSSSSSSASSPSSPSSTLSMLSSPFLLSISASGKACCAGASSSISLAGKVTAAAWTSSSCGWNSASCCKSLLSPADTSLDGSA